MNSRHRWLIAGLYMVALLAAGCGPGARAQDTVREEPSRLERVDGTELNRVILTERAAHRIDIQTEEVREELIEGVERLVIPYPAVIYGAEGEAWAYTSPAPLTFVRHALEVKAIEGDEAILSEGPPAGTLVVTVGTAELYGAEFEFQEG